MTRRRSWTRKRACSSAARRAPCAAASAKLSRRLDALRPSSLRRLASSRRSPAASARLFSSAICASPSSTRSAAFASACSRCRRSSAERASRIWLRSSSSDSPRSRCAATSARSTVTSRMSGAARSAAADVSATSIHDAHARCRLRARRERRTERSRAAAKMLRVCWISACASSRLWCSFVGDAIAAHGWIDVSRCAAVCRVAPAAAASTPARVTVWSAVFPTLDQGKCGNVGKGVVARGRRRKGQYGTSRDRLPCVQDEPGAP